MAGWRSFFHDDMMKDSLVVHTESMRLSALY
jgi:hypothetical protein